MPSPDDIRTKAKARIEKLLALSRSQPDTPEGRTARAQADRLMNKHKFRIGQSTPKPPRAASGDPRSATMSPRLRRRRKQPQSDETIGEMINVTMDFIDKLQKLSSDSDDV